MEEFLYFVSPEKRVLACLPCVPMIIYICGVRSLRRDYKNMRVPLSLSLAGWHSPGSQPHRASAAVGCCGGGGRFSCERRRIAGTEGTVAKCPPNNNINNNKPVLSQSPVLARSLGVCQPVSQSKRQKERSRNSLPRLPARRTTQGRTIIAIIAAARNNCAKKALGGREIPCSK